MGYDQEIGHSVIKSDRRCAQREESMRTDNSFYLTKRYYQGCYCSEYGNSLGKRKEVLWFCRYLETLGAGVL